MNSNPLDPINLLYAMSVPWVMIIVSLCRGTEYRKRLDFITVLGYSAFGILAGMVMMLTMHFIPARDVAFMQIDRELGFSTMNFAASISHYKMLMAFLIVTYMLLAPLFGLVWLVEQNLQMRRAVLFGGCIGVLCYALFPAVGPGHFNWNTNLPQQGSLYNCMPSLHIAWPLLMLLNTRTRWLRVLLWSYLAVTCVSTLALREHYLIDLIAAVPFAFAVDWIAERNWYERVTGKGEVVEHTVDWA